ncbi:MAG TPA: hypothetical protein VJN18_01445 [Polyangiaceae bacterium]|nr:hypothetical protein [Polyangiaceae bacterium]
MVTSRRPLGPKTSNACKGSSSQGVVNHDQAIPLLEHLSQASGCNGHALERGALARHRLEQILLEAKHARLLPERDPVDPVAERAAHVLVPRDRGREHRLADAAHAMKPGAARRAHANAGSV